MKTALCATFLVVISTLTSPVFAVNVKSTVFGVTTRTPYCAFDPLRAGGQGAWVISFWLQDVYDGNFILRYTTPNGGGSGGHLSVYEISGGNIYAVSERSIVANAAGQPTSTTGVQKYFPRKLFSPVTIADNQQVINTTSGTWGWCSGNCQPAAGTGGDYRFDVALQGTAANLLLDVDYFEDKSVGMSAPPLVFSRSSTYDATAGRTLKSFYDNIAGKTTKRFTSVNSSGVCSGG